MSDSRDDIAASIALERGVITPEQLTEVREAQRTAAEAVGIEVDLIEMLVKRGILDEDMAAELDAIVSVQTGEARQIGGYAVVSKIGQGGMGAVYEAENTDTGQKVALKILPPSMATTDMIERFKREYEIAASLDHDNIVKYVEFGQDRKKGLWFCALELIDGDDLDKYLQHKGVLTEKDTIRIARQIARALQHAYYNGLIHRDIKPHNIIVTPDGTAKLLDLGLARQTGAKSSELTEAGHFVGSPEYVSPEQATAERDIDIRSDVYSLGATMYHMATGKPPFTGSSAAHLIQQHVHEELEWPGDINTELSDDTCLVIAKMMAKDPGDRYQEPKELLADLDSLQEGAQVAITEDVLRRSAVARSATPVEQRRRLGARPPLRSTGRGSTRPKTSSRNKRISGTGRNRPVNTWRGQPPWLPYALGVGGIAPVAAIIVVLVTSGERNRGGATTNRPPRLPKVTTPATVPVPAEPATPGISTKAPADAALPRQGRSLFGPSTTRPKANRPKANRVGASPPRSVLGADGKPMPSINLDLGAGVRVAFVYIEPGTFEMGGVIDRESRFQAIETPKHTVTITKGFYIGKYEVTQSQFQAVMGRNPSLSTKGPDCPVDHTQWAAELEFCRKVSGKTGREVRLPTEAEWEYACRAGTRTPWSHGSDPNKLVDYAWCALNSGGRSHPVGLKKPNPWGLYDTHGNVCERVADMYSGNYYARSPREDPTGARIGYAAGSNGTTLLRGGTWKSVARECRSATRMRGSGYGHYHNWGFRLAMSVPD